MTRHPMALPFCTVPLAALMVVKQLAYSIYRYRFYVKTYLFGGRRIP